MKNCNYEYLLLQKNTQRTGYFVHLIIISILLVLFVLWLLAFFVTLVPFYLQYKVWKSVLCLVGVALLCGGFSIAFILKTLLSYLGKFRIENGELHVWYFPSDVRVFSAESLVGFSVCSVKSFLPMRAICCFTKDVKKSEISTMKQIHCHLNVYNKKRSFRIILFAYSQERIEMLKKLGVKEV